jgi:UDP-N-acetylglucosamine 2-epimerase (non-hydrolysing)
MIAVVFGTTGELIKLAPVLVRLRRRGSPFLLVTTGQQVTQIPIFLKEFGLPEPDLWLGHGAGGRDLAASSDIPAWLARVTRSLVRERRLLTRSLRRGSGEPAVVVHGDTMTTVIGAVAGRILRVPVAHVEGGLRSGDLRNPFPEELSRRVASRIADVHYAPGPWAARNLSRGIVVDTGSNTVRDSIDLVPDRPDGAFSVPTTDYGIVSLHRFELLNSAPRLAGTLKVLAEAATRLPLLFIDHPVTATAIERFRLGHLFAEHGLRRIPRLPFFEFLSLERHCRLVVTDSGGSQEECYYLDKPCLVHRRRTERIEGLGETTVLSRLDPNVLREFLASPERHRRRSTLPAASPSDVIVGVLVSPGFAGD